MGEKSKSPAMSLETDKSYIAGVNIGDPCNVENIAVKKGDVLFVTDVTSESVVEIFVNKRQMYMSKIVLENYGKLTEV